MLRVEKSLSKVVAMTMLGVSVGATAGCGKNSTSNVVRSVELKSAVINGDDWVQATLSLNTGGFQMAQINIPIADPTQSGLAPYGQLTVTPSFCAGMCPGGFTTDLTMALNITRVSSMKPMAAMLPNGTPLPVGGLGGATTLAIPIADTGAVVYYAFGKGVALLGTALAFSVFDPAGTYLPGVNVFFPVRLGPVDLIAGFFGGKLPKTTGLGVFLDLSGVVSMLPHSRSLLLGAGGEQYKSVLTFREVKPSLAKQVKLGKILNQLSEKHPVLDLRN